MASPQSSTCRVFRRPSPAAIGGALLALGVIAASAADPAGRKRSEAAVPRRVGLTVDGEGGGRELSGNVVLEAADGGLLLELDDQRLEIVQPRAIRSRTDLEAPADDGGSREAARDLGRRIVAELPPGFDLLVTRHYVVCFDTSRAYAQWCAALFEKLHDTFLNYWRKAGMEVVPPGRPLVVVIFAERTRYEEHAARDLGAAADRVVGYYNLLTNRVTTFDLTGSDALSSGAPTSASRAGLEILQSPAAAGLVSTLVHEASHQMAFNCGLHRRLAPVPVWVSEGVATFFETPDAGGRGWKGIGGVNKPRLEKFLAGYEPGCLEGIVLADDPFRDADGALDAYARAWALTAFLAQTRKAALAEYMALVAAKEPLAEDAPERRREDFVSAFGVGPRELEEPLLKFLARWK